MLMSAGSGALLLRLLLPSMTMSRLYCGCCRRNSGNVPFSDGRAACQATKEATQQSIAITSDRCDSVAHMPSSACCTVAEP